MLYTPGIPYDRSIQSGICFSSPRFAIFFFCPVLVGAVDRWCREHDDECRKMATAAGRIYDTFVSKDAALDYLEMVRQPCIRPIAGGTHENRVLLRIKLTPPAPRRCHTILIYFLFLLLISHVETAPPLALVPPPPHAVSFGSVPQLSHEINARYRVPPSWWTPAAALVETPPPVMPQLACNTCSREGLCTRCKNDAADATTRLKVCALFCLLCCAVVCLRLVRICIL